MASDGGIFAFGDATFFGSMGGKPLNEPVVGMAPPDRTGLLGGGLRRRHLRLRDRHSYGSMGGKPLNKPVVGIAATPQGSGTGRWPPTAGSSPSGVPSSTGPWGGSI